MTATDSIVTCPRCGHRATEVMPRDYCMVLYECRKCGVEMRPAAGDCCVFCSYGSTPCPPVQEAERSKRRPDFRP